MGEASLQGGRLVKLVEESRSFWTWVQAWASASAEIWVALCRNRLWGTLSGSELSHQPTPHPSPWWAEEKWHFQTENGSPSISPVWHPDIITIYLEKRGIETSDSCESSHFGTYFLTLSNSRRLMEQFAQQIILVECAEGKERGGEGGGRAGKKFFLTHS